MTGRDDLQALSADLVVQAARLVRLVRQRGDVPPGFRVLSMLDQHGPLGVTRLAALDNCAQPTMSATVSGLVARGVVTKEAHPDDARASVVTLTAAGRAELDRTRAGNGATVADLAAATGLDADAVAAAVVVLHRLLDLEHPHLEHPDPEHPDPARHSEGTP